MTSIRSLMLGSATLLLCQTAVGVDIRYVGTRDILIAFAPASGKPVTDVELWVSEDDGRAWRKETVQRAGDTAVRYAAPRDGRYGFYLVLKNAGGTSGPPPEAGNSPLVRVVVDTVAPTFQLHGATESTSERGRVLTLRTTAVDENLGPMGLRVFYRAGADAPWIDGGNAATAGETVTWPIPKDTVGPLDIRVTATDLAGNQAADELHGISLGAASEGAATTRPALGSVLDGADAEAAFGAVVAVRVEPAEPVTLEHSTSDISGPTSRPVGAEQFRRLGQKLMEERRFDLAAARFEEAVKLAPDDPDLLVDLGGAFYRLQRYADADARFGRALESRPDDSGALEGLALVAATERRYPQAREHLLHLLRVRPEQSVTWLRYGDIEHKLGNTDQAQEAWERVLKLPGTDETVREKAKKRLSYFGAARRPTAP